MGKCKNLKGKRFGKLVVIKRIENYTSPKGKTIARWLCKCDCGKYLKTTTNHLTTGDTTSCGCKNIARLKDHQRTSNIKHGQTHKRIYRIWCDMKTRCYNPNFPNFKYYGGKGIKIYKPWLEDFREFYKWAMSHGYEDNLTLDRKNGNKNYEPLNCRWITMKKQNLNRKNNVKVIYDGEEITLYELSQKLNISQWALYKRYKKGERGEKLIRPIRNNGRMNKMQIKELVKESFNNAKAHGFWEDYSPAHEKQFINNAIGNRLMLITTEVAEAEDGLRKDDFENFKEELADIVIRTCDLAGGLNIDLEAEIIKKMEKNKSREYKHGKAF